MQGEEHEEKNYIMSRKTTQTTSKDAIVQIWTFAKMEKNFHQRDTNDNSKTESG